MPADTPEARRYNRIRRWLSIADFALGLILLIGLLASGWNSTLRDLAYRASFQTYTLSKSASANSRLSFSQKAPGERGNFPAATQIPGRFPPPRVSSIRRTGDGNGLFLRWVLLIFDSSNPC
jgi:hypothetical protein